MNPSPQLASSSSEPPQLVGAELDEILHEENDMESDSTRPDPLQGSAWKGYLIAALPVLVCLFGAGREAWSKGIAAILMALMMLFFAPQRKLPLFARACFLGALLAPCLTFLPARWLASAPAWRSHLTKDWGIQLSDTFTPQAAVTLEAWLFFALCLLWLAWCLTRGFSGEQRRAMIHTLAIGGMALSALSILEKLGILSIPWWPRNWKEWGDAFGPFANRNHISSLAAITYILCAASALDAHRRKSHLWMLFVSGLAISVITIFTNTSKAGVILLFLGLTVWLGTSAMRKGFFKKLAISTALVFIIATVLVMSEGGVSSRLATGGLEGFLSPGGRSLLLVATLGMMMHAPWLGVGLGHFETVFPLVTTMHEPRSRFLHPESDLLWLLAEGGLLTVLPCVLLLFWIFQATGPWFGKKSKDRSERRDRKFRNAAAIAFGLGAVHGIVDVPNHGLGYALFMGILAGIALRPRRRNLTAGRVERLGFRVASVGVLVLGLTWMAISLGHPVLAGSSAGKALRTRANQLVESGSPSDALPLMDEAIRMTPMNFHLYYERACIRLLLGQQADAAFTDFSRARALEPHYAALCYSEGVVWLDFDARYAIIGWREFLRRYPAAAPGVYGHYRQMLNHAARHPELREPLWALATSAELKLDFLGSVTTREEFDRCLSSLLAIQPELNGLEAAQRETLFGIWNRVGDRAALIAALETNRQWRDQGWPLLAESYAQNSDFQRAYQTALPHFPSLKRTAPGTSTDIPALERARLYHPTDARLSIDLFEAQKNQGNIDGAIHTLEQVMTTPNAPPYVRQEIAALYALKQDFRRAWEYLHDAMRQH